MRASIALAVLLVSTIGWASGSMLLTAGGLATVGLGFLIFALARSEGYETTYGVCAPARYDSLTGQPATAPRRIVVELGPPPGWKEPGTIATVRPVPAVSSQSGFLTEWTPPAPLPTVYAQYNPAFDSDLEPEPQRNVVKLKPAKPAAAPAAPAQETEEQQLVVTPAGFRYTGRFEHLEIKR